jgi:hypothetical protein
VVNENVFVRYKWNDNHINTFRNSLIAKLQEFNRLTCAVKNGNLLSINDALNTFTSLIRNVADPLFSKTFLTGLIIHFPTRPRQKMQTGMTLNVREQKRHI